MELSQEQQEEIERLSGMGYTLRQIAMYLDVSLSEIECEFYDPGSTFRHHYDRGILMAVAEQDIALSKAAKNGSVTAVQILDNRRREQRLKDFKTKLLNGIH